MNATIDIKTPAGQLLDGYPKTIIDSYKHVSNILKQFHNCYIEPYEEDLLELKSFNNLALHPGDVITITIKE